MSITYDTEEWKPIKDFENSYEVSNYGNVRSIDRYRYCKSTNKPNLFKGKLLKQRFDKYGYSVVNLKKQQKSNIKKVHRLVAIAFIQTNNIELNINHKDGNKQNNKVENLEWCTVKENTQHRIDVTPKNTESRAISIMMKLIKKHNPQIKWVISFADACSCGDGTIYRASGFKLLGINNSQQLYKLPDGSKLHLMSLQGGNYSSKRKEMFNAGYTNPKKYMEEVLNGEKLNGYQLKYIYFLDKSKEKDLTVPILPFSKIEEIGASMYLGKKVKYG